MPISRPRRFDLDATVLDQLPDAVVLLDASGCITAVNDRAMVVLGLRSADVGRRFGDVVDLRDAGGTRCPVPPPTPAIGTRTPERILRRRGPDGLGPPLAVVGRWTPEGFSLTLRAAGRRGSLDRVHGEVIATVSHELRSPLTTVKGFTRSLLTGWDRYDDEQKLTMLRAVDADADRLTRLLRDLLSVARIDAGRVQIRRMPVDVAAVARQVVDRARQSEAATDRPVEIEVSAATPTITGDPDRLAQVITNLVDNALLHARQGAVTVRVGPADGGVSITVDDHGPGVPDHLRAAVFRKFARGRDDHGPGTGLGLYITQGLVFAHGGRIRLGPAGTTGASFRVWLPADPPDTLG